MTGRIGQTMRNGQPDVVQNAPTVTYWQQRRAWDREIKEAVESGAAVAPLVVDQEGVLLADIDASAFVPNDGRQVHGAILRPGSGWCNDILFGTVDSQRITAALPLFVGQQISRIVANVFGDAAVQITLALTLRSADSSTATPIAAATSALTATAQHIDLRFAAVFVGKGDGTYFLDVDLPPNGAASLRLWSVQLYS